MGNTREEISLEMIEIILQIIGIIVTVISIIVTVIDLIVSYKNKHQKSNHPVEK